MIDFLKLFVHVVILPFQLEAKIVLLRHQLNVLRRRVPSKPKLAAADRLLFVWLYRLFPSMLNAVTIVPHGRSSGGIGLASACCGAGSRARVGGRPKVSLEIRRLIREMSFATGFWGAPRIPGEL